MNQLTIRGFDNELKEHIRKLAEREGLSLNRAALKLLRKGAGLSDGRYGGNKIGAALDHFFGTMSKEEADELDAIIEEEFEKIDESMWR